MLIIGITGASGSGKSHFSRLLIEQLGYENVSYLELDNYYHPKNTQLKDENGIENFDLPTAFNHSKLTDDILSLKQKKCIQFTRYNYNNTVITSENIVVEPKKILIIEGIFVFNFDEILPLYDLKIFIYSPAEINLKRRLHRDELERGYKSNDVQYRYNNHVLPAFLQYIKPTKNLVDIVIPNNSNLKKPVELIYHWIDHKINP